MRLSVVALIAVFCLSSCQGDDDSEDTASDSPNVTLSIYAHARGRGDQKQADHLASRLTF